MADTKTENLRDCAIISIICIFALSYFYLFTLQFLLYRFPPSADEIIGSLSVLFFSGGVILACLSSLIYRIISAFQGDAAADWQKLEFVGKLILIFSVTIPSVVLQFSKQPTIQLGYLSAFTIVTIGNVVDFLVLDSSATVFRTRFPYHCVSLGLLALVPTIHALTGTYHNASPLAIQFSRLAVSNALGGAFYLAQPLERLGVANGWQPSLYVMNLICVLSCVIYSREVLFTELRGRSSSS